MTQEAPRSPQELTAREGLRETFLKILNSRVTGEIQDGYSAYLKIEPDDTDGEINLPTSLNGEVLRHYRGIPKPPDAKESVGIRTIMIGENDASIEIEPILVNLPEAYADYPILDRGRAISTEILFDFERGVYSLEFVRVSPTGQTIRENGEPVGYVEEHRITAEMQDRFAEILPILSQRALSEVTIIRSS